MLSAARGALQEALDHAERHDLWFEFTGLRRGPGESYRTSDMSNPRDIAEVRESFTEIIEAGDTPPDTRVDVLDLAEEWVGSWC